jgi:hypothetical protein
MWLEIASCIRGLPPSIVEIVSMRDWEKGAVDVTAMIVRRFFRLADVEPIELEGVAHMVVARCAEELEKWDGGDGSDALIAALGVHMGSRGMAMKTLSVVVERSAEVCVWRMDAFAKSEWGQALPDDVMGRVEHAIVRDPEMLLLAATSLL